MLDLQDVRVKFGEYSVLRGVSLKVQREQIVGLVGRNGAGKTTTLKSIMGLVPVESGAIRLNDLDLLQMPAHRRAHIGVGYMPEDRRLIAPLTVQQNILLPAWATDAGDIAARLEWVQTLVPAVRELSDRQAVYLSGGEQKLVALARALISGRELLILDEPFEGVSATLSEKLFEIVRALKEQGQAILIAESDQRLSQLAEHIYTIERGEIIP